MARLISFRFAHGGHRPLQITRSITLRPMRLHAIHDNICDRTARTFLIHASGPENYCHHFSPALARSVAQSSPPLSAELHKRKQSLHEIQLPCVSLIPIRCQRPSWRRDNLYARQRDGLTSLLMNHGPRRSFDLIILTAPSILPLAGLNYGRRGTNKCTWGRST